MQQGTVTIKTERLVLRRMRPMDFWAALSWYRDRALNRYFTARTQNTAWDTVRFVFGKLPKYRKKDFWCWAIETNGKMQGMIQAIPVPGRPRDRALYYMLNPRLSGLGLMTEAVQAVLAYLRCQDVPAVYAACDSENLASRRVLEKAGLVQTEWIKQGGVHYADGRVSDQIYYRKALSDVVL